MGKKAYIAVVLLLLSSAVALVGCQKAAPVTYSRDIFAMDTYINCKIVSGDPILAEAGLNKVEEAFLEIDRLTNRFDSNSEVSLINTNAGISPVKVSEDVFKMIETSIKWSDKTDGAFNILIGSVMNLWGFGTENPAVPTAAELEQALNNTDYRQIVCDAEQTTVYLPEQGMVIDLGGIAKGYATDKAVTALRELNIDNAIINAGGNVYVLGSKAEGVPWKIGVQDPRDPQGIKAVLTAADCALVSSGDYQRYFEADGIRYHHILDPATGYPARRSTGSTVIMKSAAEADILSTAIFVKGPMEGIELAEELSQVDAAMVIVADGEVYGTQTLKRYLAGD